MPDECGGLLWGWSPSSTLGSSAPPPSSDPPVDTLPYSTDVLPETVRSTDTSMYCSATSNCAADETSPRDSVSPRGRLSECSSRALSASRPVVSRAPMLKLSRRQWASDRLYPQCHNCRCDFTLWTRRHHCRICGLVFCNSCSSHSVSTNSMAGRVEGDTRDFDMPPDAQAVVRVRVCVTCAQLHAGQPNSPLLVDERGPVETKEAFIELAGSLRTS